MTNKPESDPLGRMTGQPDLGGITELSSVGDYSVGIHHLDTAVTTIRNQMLGSYLRSA